MGAPLDTIIIGAGTAGLAALREVRKRTDRYLIVNDGPWGTTCARVGCMPSKMLIEAASTFHRRHVWNELGLRGATALVADWCRSRPIEGMAVEVHELPGRTPLEAAEQALSDFVRRIARATIKTPRRRG